MTMKKFGLFLILSFIIIGSVVADNGDEKGVLKEQAEASVSATYSLQGTVYDPVCNEAISGATIVIDGKKYYSDFSGNFEIPALAKGKHIISVDFVSYQNKAIEVDLDKNQDLEIQLKQQ